MNLLCGTQNSTNNGKMRLLHVIILMVFLSSWGVVCKENVKERTLSNKEESAIRRHATRNVFSHPIFDYDYGSYDDDYDLYMNGALAFRKPKGKRGKIAALQSTMPKMEGGSATSRNAYPPGTTMSDIYDNDDEEDAFRSRFKYDWSMPEEDYDTDHHMYRRRATFDESALTSADENQSHRRALELALSHAKSVENGKAVADDAISHRFRNEAEEANNKDRALKNSQGNMVGANGFHYPYPNTLIKQRYFQESYNKPNNFKESSFAQVMPPLTQPHNLMKSHFRNQFEPCLPTKFRLPYMSGTPDFHRFSIPRNQPRISPTRRFFNTNRFFIRK